MAKPRSKTKKILFAVEIIVLLLFIGGLYVYGQLNSRLDKLEKSKTENAQPIEVNQEVQDSINAEESKLTGYTTYALFGIDHRDMSSTGGMNSDTMIIASVNNDTKDVKLASVYRDTLLNVYDDTYSKANAAYARSPEAAVNMLNRNLDLNITDYATVNFSALTEIVDALDGLDIDMSYAEIVHMNSYCEETSKETGKPYEPIELPERPEDIEKIDYRFHLNGVQVTSYCRIRYTASLDMGRTERQRKVIQLIVQKAKKAGLPTIFKVMDAVFPMVSTSMDKTEILQLLPTVIGYSLNETTGFPSSIKFSNVKGSVIVPTKEGTSEADLVSNVIALHKFLYGDEAYTPSSTVQEISAKIAEIVSGLGELEDTQKITAEDENTANDSIIFENDGSGWVDNSTDWVDPGTGDDGSSDWVDPGTGDTGGGDTGSGDTGSGDTGSGDTGSGDVGGGDTGGGDVGGGDIGGGDAGGGDIGGGDVGGGDAGGGDVGGEDIGGGDAGGGDIGGGDAGGGDGFVDEGTGEEVM